MSRVEIEAVLVAALPAPLATDLVDAFMDIRKDVATGVLGRSAPGKFVESVVQALQHLASGTYDAHPNVDDYLRNADTRAVGLDDGLRICGARIARAMYTLRNKRNIAHKGAVDPNVWDLRFLLASAQWILSELVRHAGGSSMTDAGKAVEAINTPVGGIVEDVGGRRVVHGTVTLREELLVLIHSFDGKAIGVGALSGALERRSAGAVRSEVRKMWSSKLLVGDGKAGYQLTKTGVIAATEVLMRESRA
jgi:hypothetical protein